MDAQHDLAEGHFSRKVELASLSQQIELPLLIIMVGSPLLPSCMDDVRSTSVEYDPYQWRSSESQYPSSLAQSAQVEPTLGHILSPFGPITPTHTPALSNDVPFGAVAPKHLQEDLEQLAGHANNGVVQQSRFATPEQQDSAVQISDRSRHMVMEWDDGTTDDDELKQDVFDLQPKQSVNEPIDDDPGADADDEMEEPAYKCTNKRAEKLYRRSSAWKSRQGGLAELRSSFQHIWKGSEDDSWL